MTAACELYLAHGLDGFSMRRLAKRVGVTAPALYRHYEGKEGVLADVVREAYSEMTRYIYRALGAPTPLERFRGAGEAFLDFVIEHPKWSSILNVGPEALGMETVPTDIEEMGCAVHQFWVDRVRECMEAGILKGDDPVMTSVTLWAHAHGLVQLYQQGLLRVTPDEFRALFKASGQRMMAGLGTDDFVAEMQEMAAAEAAAAGADGHGRGG